MKQAVLEDDRGPRKTLLDPAVVSLSNRCCRGMHRHTGFEIHRPTPVTLGQLLNL